MYLDVQLVEKSGNLLRKLVVFSKFAGIYPLKSVRLLIPSLIGWQKLAH